MAGLGAELASIATAVGQMIVSLFSSLGSVFYTAGADGTAGELTFLGYVLFFGVIVGLVILLINWIRGLIGRRMG